MKVFILEDDVLEADRIVQSVKEFFSGNCEIIGPYADFSSGIEAIKNNAADSAILDIQLGSDKYGGINFAEVLQKIYYVPIIFLTGVSEQSILEKAEKIPYCEFLKKPFNKQAIMKALKRAELTQIYQMPSRHRTSILQNSSEKFWAKIGRSEFKGVLYDDIPLIRSIGHYNEVFCITNKHPLIIKGNLRSEIFLPHFSIFNSFYLLGRSHVINKKFLSSIQGNILEISLNDDKIFKVDIPRNSKNLLFKWLGMNHE